jgi:hypothetical protein
MVKLSRIFAVESRFTNRATHEFFQMFLRNLGSPLESFLTLFLLNKRDSGVHSCKDREQGAFMKSISLPLLLLSTSAHAMIIGGVDMTAHDPIQQSTAAMYEPSGNGAGGALCTASLIGKNTALTAAHCVQQGGYAPVMIFGPNVHSPDSVQRPVTGVAVNPKWQEKRGRGMDQGDIAVVKFGGGLPKGYRPATLDSPKNEIKKGDPAILAGYGVSNAKTHEGAGTLRKTTVSVAAVRKGKSEMIFDQAHGHGACHGDSGGPAYFQHGKKMVLAGVTNRSYPNTAADDCGHKVVYTKVAAYRPWIEKSEADLNQKPVALPTLANNSAKESRHRLAKPVSRRPLRKTPSKRKSQAAHRSRTRSVRKHHDRRISRLEIKRR